MSVRTQELKANVVVKGHSVAARGLQKVGEGKAFRLPVRLCMERARFLTESYRQTEGEPMVIRRAKGLQNILSKMTIFIMPGELLVGNFASGPDAVTYYPELTCSWIEKAVHGGYSNLLDDAGRNEMKELHKFWKGRSVQGMERDLVPDDVKPFWKYKGPALWMHFFEMATPNYEKILRLGLNGLIEEVQQKKKEIEDGLEN